MILLLMGIWIIDVMYTFFRMESGLISVTPIKDPVGICGE